MIFIFLLCPLTVCATYYDSALNSNIKSKWFDPSSANVSHSSQEITGSPREQSSFSTWQMLNSVRHFISSRMQSSSPRSDEQEREPSSPVEKKIPLVNLFRGVSALSENDDSIEDDKRSGRYATLDTTPRSDDDPSFDIGIDGPVSGNEGNTIFSAKKKQISKKPSPFQNQGAMNEKQKNKNQTSQPKVSDTGLEHDISEDNRYLMNSGSVLDAIGGAVINGLLECSLIVVIRNKDGLGTLRPEDKVNVSTIEALERCYSESHLQLSSLDPNMLKENRSLKEPNEPHVSSLRQLSRLQSANHSYSEIHEKESALKRR